MSTFDRFIEINQQFNQIYVQWAKHCGFTANEFFVLYKIGREQSCSPKEIAEEFSLPKQTVTSVCQNLQQKGYVAYVPDPNDKRGKLFTIQTDKQAKVLAMIDDLTQHEQATIKQFGAKRFTELLSSLHEVQTILSNHLFDDGEA